MKDKLINMLTDKGTRSSAEVARILIKEPSKIPIIVEGLDSGKAKIKYGSAKALLIISERSPELLYPYFDVFIDRIYGENNILKWASIDIISNFSFVDVENKIDKKLLNDFFQMMSGDSLITAGHIIDNLWKIAINGKYDANKITIEMLKYEKSRITEECKSILAGHIIESFSKFFDLLNINNKEEVLAFAKKQTSCLRSGTRRKANTFLKKFKENNYVLL